MILDRGRADKIRLLRASKRNGGEVTTDGLLLVQQAQNVFQLAD